MNQVHKIKNTFNMKVIYFNTESGQLMLNNIHVAPFDEQKFIVNMKENAIDIEKHTTGTHIRNFSTSRSLKGLEFGINFIFDCAHMQSVWMSWDGGNTKKYGYDTTESQLLSDKDTLVKLLSKSFNRNPDEINKASSTFQFPWGHISASASIQSSTAAIGISWNFWKS